jgi:hypothetical protein
MLHIGYSSLTEKTMLIQVNTSNDIKDSQNFDDYVKGVVEVALSHVSDHITRVEVHLSHKNGQKSSDNDKRCVMEARLEHRQPIAVSNDAATFELAVVGATEKLKSAVTSILDRQRDQSHVNQRENN